MPAFFSATVTEFLRLSGSELTGMLTAAYAGSGFTTQKTSQTKAWIADIRQLQAALATTASQAQIAPWTIALEFSIPRKEKRIDVVLLAHNTIVILELKSSHQGIGALRQAEEYALLLHYFHRPSARRRIVTFVVSPSEIVETNLEQMFLPIEEAPAFWVSPAQQIRWQELPSKLQQLGNVSGTPIDPSDWLNGEYRPVPTIIDAARSLHSGLHQVREIAHSHAARHDVEVLTHFVGSLIQRARAEQQFIIVFLTGVPGSGKTLVGLNLAFAPEMKQEAIHFMSGTGPLVQVLQAVLAQNHLERTGTPAQAARMYAQTLIENVHVFASTYANDEQRRAPSNHVVIFDEAQRAWNKQQNLSKFKRDYSEPEMLLQIMERHPDWSVVIALVGGGQEINSGEAGIAEWGRALREPQRKPWSIYASPEAIYGGKSVAGSELFGAEATQLKVHVEGQLHLNVSIRSLRADVYSSWVNAVIAGNADEARSLDVRKQFPIFLTRSLSDTRRLLLENSRGESRCGLVASSAATRLRAEGLEPDSTFHGEYPWHHWYLAPSSDVRSSYQLEVFATEFEIQGLELDWIGLCWGGDFLWSNTETRWVPRAFRHGPVSRWSLTMSDERKLYRHNAYRVLLTRARQGIVLYIPPGDPADPTRDPTQFDETVDFLLRCGARLAGTR